MDISINFTALLVAMSIPSAITGFCFWLLERKIQKRDDEEKTERAKRHEEIDKRDEQRKEYELYQIKMISASMAVATATAEAVQRIPDAHCNGEMKAALEYAEQVKHEQKDFMQKLALDNMVFSTSRKEKEHHE